VAEGFQPVEPLRLPVGADPAGLAALRTRLRSWLTVLETPHRITAAVLVAAEEALNNAIEHGGTGETREGRPITLTASRTEGWIDVAVSDPGPWREPASPPQRGRGHGLELMEAMMTAVSVETGAEHTTVHMRARLPCRARSATGESGEAP
jgi:anti-sigma regulatory factor (Ser/Thr protein kinase)